MARYYSILRPISPGSFPRDGVIEIVNFNRREHVPDIGRAAWGYIDYSRVLTEREAADYDLMAAGKVIDKKALIDFMVNAGMGKREIGGILKKIAAGEITVQEAYEGLRAEGRA